MLKCLYNNRDRNSNLELGWVKEHKNKIEGSLRRRHRTTEHHNIKILKTVKRTYSFFFVNNFVLFLCNDK